MKVYKQVINGVEHTIQYSDEDAKALGLTADHEPKPQAKARSAANKARTTKNKS